MVLSEYAVSVTGPQNLMGTVLGEPHNCTVLVSGLPGRSVLELSKQLTAGGMDGESTFCCEFKEKVPAVRTY